MILLCYIWYYLDKKSEKILSMHSSTCGIFSQSFDENSVYKSIEIKDKFKQCALKNNCVFVNASDFADTKSTDGIHLNEKGHYALAKALFECIEKNFL